jgi:hypothetical protein
MIIFHRFPSPPDAFDFARTVKCIHGLKAKVCFDQAESDKIDPFPCRLRGPVVLVDRSDPETERKVERLVLGFGGTYAGT